METRAIAPFRQISVALLIVLAYAVFFGGTFEASYALPFLALSQALALGAVLVWGWHLLRSGRGLPHSPIDAGLALLVLAHLFSTITSADPRLSLETTLYLVLFVLLYYLFLDWFTGGGSPEVLGLTLRSLSQVVIVAALVELAVWHWGIFAGAGWTETVAGLAFYRGRLVMEHANPQGWFLGMMVPLWLDRWDKQTSRKGKIEALFWLFLLLGVLVSTFSRAGWLAAGAGAVAWVAFSRISKLRGVMSFLWRTPGRRIATSAVLGVVFVLLALGAWTVATRIRPDSASFRLELWYLGLQLLREKPLLGAGPGSFGLAVQSLIPPAPRAGDLATQAHNGYLNLVAETGLIGFIALAILGVQMVRVLLRALQARGEIPLRRSHSVDSWGALFSALIAFSAANLLDTTSHFPYMTFLLVLLSASLLAPWSRATTSGPRWRGTLPWVLSGILLLSFAGIDFAHLSQWRGIRAALAGDVEAAESVFQQAIRIDPTLRVYPLQLGVVRTQKYLEEGDRQSLQEALGIFQEQVDAGLPHSLLQSNLAWLEWYAGDPGRALATMRQAVSRTPLHPWLWMGLGFLNEKAGDLESARQAYSLALALRPPLSRSAFWRTSLLGEDRDELLQQAMALVPSIPRMPTSLVPARQALLAFYAGEEATARALVDSAPVSEEQLLVKGLLALQAGDFSRAREAASQVLALDATRGQAYLLRGRALLALGDPSLARRDFLVATRFGEPSGQAYIGDILYEQGAYAAAIPAYEEGLRPPCPAPPFIYDFESNVYHRPDFLPDFTPQILRCAPQEDLLPLYLHLADAYRRVGQEEDAAQLLLWLDEYNLGTT